MAFGSTRTGLRDRVDNFSKTRVLLLLGLTMLTPVTRSLALAPRQELKTGTARNREMLQREAFRPLYNFVSLDIQSRQSGSGDGLYRDDPAFNGAGDRSYNRRPRHERGFN
jgi:hypothetical protein